MLRNRIARGLAGLSLLLALGAMLFLALWPNYYRGEEVSPEGGVVARTSASLIEENGLDVLAVLLLPVGFCLWAFVVSLLGSRPTKAVLWVMAVLLLGFSLFTSLTVGAFYFPAALALILAASLAKTRPEASP